MHVHILGICGTFMGGIAALARAAGHTVTGSDKNVYPPMSDQLAALDIDLFALDDLAQFVPTIDVVVIGNVMSRGAVAVEHVLNERMPYTSGPAWLARHVLRQQRVIAVAGTHGKTTTASMVAWLLECAGLSPGFLIGGVPNNFGLSARFGAGDWFVVEADEYDTAFFDKRSKFVHYGPTVAVLNNLEFDHADIFPNLDAIKTQFHHLVRTVPGNGTIVVNEDDRNLADVLRTGLWSPRVGFGERAPWRAALSGGRLTVLYPGGEVRSDAWSLPGQHNALNAAAACAAASCAGAAPDGLREALTGFAGVRRRAEQVGHVGGVTVYDDFAHHPTAIRKTLTGFRSQAQGRRLLAVVELRSNTMKLGIHALELNESLELADEAWLFAGDDAAPAHSGVPRFSDIDALLRAVHQVARANDIIVVMSNGGFGGFARRLVALLESGIGEEAP